MHDRCACRGVVVLLCGEGPGVALKAQKLAEGGQGGGAQPRRLPQQPCLKHGSAALARYAVESVQRVGRRQPTLSAPFRFDRLLVALGDVRGRAPIDQREVRGAAQFGREGAFRPGCALRELVCHEAGAHVVPTHSGAVQNASSGIVAQPGRGVGQDRVGVREGLAQGQPGEHRCGAARAPPDGEVALVAQVLVPVALQSGDGEPLAAGGARQERPARTQQDGGARTPREAQAARLGVGTSGPAANRPAEVEARQRVERHGLERDRQRHRPPGVLLLVRPGEPDRLGDELGTLVTWSTWHGPEDELPTVVQVWAQSEDPAGQPVGAEAVLVR